MIDYQDMPKLESPFVRKMIGGRFLVTDKVSEDYEWVFKDNCVLATEKLDGTNVCLLIKNSKIQGVWNRENSIPYWSKNKTHQYIQEGIMNSLNRNYIDSLHDGFHYGELVGPKINKNKYNLEKHIWIPFNTYVRENLYFKTWGKYPKNYETISSWFENGLFSIYNMRVHEGQKIFAEGVVFHHPDGRMAKLRRDMFDWYEGVPHKSERSR